MLNWIAWNRTVLTFKLRTYAKLNCLTFFLTPKLYSHWTKFEIELFWHSIVCKQKLYLYKTELFEIELFICIKMDLVLNNLQRLICQTTQTNKTSNQLCSKLSQFSGLQLIAGLCVGILVYIYIYIPAFNLVVFLGLYWITNCLIFVSQLDASWDPWAGKCYCYYYCYNSTVVKWYFTLPKSLEMWPHFKYSLASYQDTSF